MSNNEIFNLNNISKNFGEIEVLSSLSLSIKKGELIALIGPSGAGKTTLLNTLATIVKPDSGKLLIDGIDSTSYTNRKKLAKKIGIIRQQFDLIGPLPVIHNVLAGRLNEWGIFKSALSLIVPQDKAIASKALNRVGILDKIYNRTSELSGGQQQRVALARLLVQNPQVILADEPVSSLDPARSEDVLSIMVNLVKEENQTLIASLHSIKYAKKYFNRIIALRDGKVYFDLPSSKVNDDVLTSLYTIKEHINND
ncbi:MAG: phosphonate ABC transporter ATP-binding protein [Clostridium sp.]